MDTNLHSGTGLDLKFKPDSLVRTPSQTRHGPRSLIPSFRLEGESYSKEDYTVLHTALFDFILSDLNMILPGNHPKFQVNFTLFSHPSSWCLEESAQFVVVATCRSWLL
jgi:hypothetical protein